MKWILVLCFIFFTKFNDAQNLKIELKTKSVKQDSILKLFQQKQSFKDFSALTEEFESIIKQLQYKGYFNLRYSNLKPINDSVFQSAIDLRKKYNVVEIKNYDEYLKTFEESTPYIKVESLSTVLFNLLNDLSRQGKPFSQIQLRKIKFNESDTISAEISLEISDKRTLDDIVLKGYEKFPLAFIKHYANIKKGKTFDKDKLITNSERLELLRFVRQKQVPQVQFTKDSTKLFLYLEKQQANSFDGFIGFNNSEDNEFQLNGNIDLSLINNFNAGEEIKLNYKNDGNAQEWFDIGIRLPYLFKSRFILEAGLGFFKQDSTFSNTNQNIKLDYQVSQNINIGVKTAFENSSNLLDNNLSVENLRDYSKSSYSLEAFYNRPKRLNRLFLSSQYFSLGFGVSQRESEAVTTNQQFIKLEARQIFKLNNRQFIFTGLNAGLLNSDDYLFNELYRFGGINSIRGFLENRFFANLYGTLQTEYRYILGSNLYIHSVLDYGFYENDIDRFSENLYAVGIGFGLETKAGVLRLILANGGSDSQKIEFTNMQIHLNFISIF